MMLITPSKQMWSLFTQGCATFLRALGFPKQSILRAKFDYFSLNDFLITGVLNSKVSYRKVSNSAPGANALPCMKPM